MPLPLIVVAAMWAFTAVDLGLWAFTGKDVIETVTGYDPVGYVIDWAFVQLGISDPEPADAMQERYDALVGLHLEVAELMQLCFFVLILLVLLVLALGLRGKK